MKKEHLSLTKNFILLLVLIVQLTPTALSAKPSVYEEKIILPECDSTNPEVQIINSKADWKLINHPDKRIFCISPGDYTGDSINLTASGTASKPRYILLNNGNNTHPGKLDRSQQSNVQIAFDNAHYWVVDRMSSLDIRMYPVRFRNASTHNIINRALVLRFDRGVTIHEGSSNNTIQNSRVGDMNAKGLKGDKVCISLLREKIIPFISVKNTKVLNNEIFNCNDGFQAVRHPQIQLADYAGTIVDNNDIFNETSMFTDCNGNRDPKGKCACSENAIDIKAGSDDENNPMVITNNRMWGYRKNDHQCGGSNDHGAAIGVHLGVNNLIFEENIIFDSAQGISVAAKGIFQFSLGNSSISNNTFYNIGVGNPNEYQDGNVITTLEAENILVNNNVIVNGGSWLKASTKKIWSVNSTYSCNIVINSQSKFNRMDESSTLHNNSFYNTPHYLKGRGDTYFVDSIEANTKELVFITDRYTNSPKEIVLKNAIPQISVPDICQL